MADLTDTSTWETGIYQLELLDPAQGGAGGKSNQQAQQLANRTAYLKDAVDEINNRENYNLDYSDFTVATNSLKNCKGTAYNPVYPLADWDYATPNDGITRKFKITISAKVGFTYDGSHGVKMFVFATTAGPTVVELCRANTIYPGGTIFMQKVVTIGPNVKVIGAIDHGATGSTASIDDCSFHIEEIEKL